jgi:Na+-translocating ferredoxin:NAD+ oxidoreductase RnfG subunit
MDVVGIVVIAVVAIAVIALIFAMTRRSKVAHEQRRQEVGEARDVAREQHQRAELSEAEKHRARADVAGERAERERLAAELHETRAQNGAPVEGGTANGEQPVERDPVRGEEAARAGRSER